MTKEEALNVASICGVLVNSKQLSFGVIRILNKNAKIANEIGAEIKEIYELAKGKELSKESTEEEVQRCLKEEFKGEFINLKSSFLFETKSEILDFKEVTLGNKPFDVRTALEVLDAQNLIED